MRTSHFSIWATGIALLVALGAGTGCGGDDDEGGGGKGGSTGGTGAKGGTGGGGTGGGGTGGGGTGGGGTGGGGTGGGGTGGEAGGGGTAGGGGAAGGGGTAGGGGSAGGSGNHTCQEYCDLFKANCTGALYTYTNDKDCTDSCAAFAQGTPGETTGNTLECRFYHATAAGGGAGDATTHCPHAGKTPTEFCK